MTTSPPTVRVALPLPIGEGYDYLLPDPGTPIPLGTLVEVPLGRGLAIGAVWGPGSGDVAVAKLRPLGRVLPDVPPLPDVTRRFVDWVAGYTLSPRGLVLKMVLGGRLAEAKPLDLKAAPLPTLDPDSHVPILTPEQAEAAEVLVEATKAQIFSVTVLDGVTGSGKTEVYAEALATALRQGQQALVLLPEIAMTAALLDRFAARFGAPPTLWHSEMTPRQRRQAWHAIAEGRARFVLGARSALFLPFPNLGLIVVDEEHEAAYKQDEGVIYHGRDMAVTRGHLGSVPVVLTSATPSLETLHNARRGRYKHVRLHARFGAAQMPTLTLVDMREHKMPAHHFLSPPLMEAVQATLESGQQALLFLNRRGYAPLTLCRACGHRLSCPHCTCWLVAHQSSGRLHCHHCGYSTARPTVCPACAATDTLASVGPGVERLAEEVKARLPMARTAVAASDTLAGPEAARKLVAQLHDQTINLLIGTQVMAKGYHFPRLTLVGVVDADLGLGGGGDPRAAERTFQLLQQVAGRSGRAAEAGRVIVQTTAPEHPVMQALKDGGRDAFLEAEMCERATWNLPPFARLAHLTLSGPEAETVSRYAERLVALAPQREGLQILGPAPAPFARLRGKYRYRILVRAVRGGILAPILRPWIAALDLPRTLRLHVDVDPYSFL